MLEPEESALLLGLGDAGAHRLDWPVFLRSFAAFFQTESAMLFLSQHYWGWDRPRAAHMGSVALPLVFAGLRAGRVYSGEELHDRALARDLVWLGGGDTRAIALTCTHGPACMVLRREKGAFRAADTARLAGFAPHIAQALELWHMLQAATAQQRQTQDFARRIGIGALVLDLSKPALVEMDKVAAGLLADCGLDVAAVLSAARTRATPALVALGGGLDMLVVPGEAATGQAVAYLRQTMTPLPDAGFLAAALGISRAEARLARALGEGASLAGAAAQLGLTIETARNYSKRIYARTGLRGQAALVRYLWCSAVLLAR
ncbi:helix-turn-helix transcriptional regulator [Roseinatronobacter sp. NSM]|uniref:helix-turn-helix transcriptional regulator n=1 Tax=Roseinatronobacter sp. NSM TaxID=3457785 RepID=UPI0040351CE8